jgi:alkylation response protein AidB-like acyl-CoA dehydrogenase
VPLGVSPWVTAGKFADWLVVGAVEMEDTRNGNIASERAELLVAIPGNAPGVLVEQSAELLALNGSSTGAVRFTRAQINPSQILHGPVPNVMSISSGTSGGPGGLQTSALAIGLSAQTIGYLVAESANRLELQGTAKEFQKQWIEMFAGLMAIARGESEQDPGVFRKEANDLALNSSQAALAAAKGAGYSRKHDVGRWCKEALFFLVWSCPQSVVRSHLCSFVS